MVGRLNPQSLLIGVHRLDKKLSDLAQALIRLNRFFDNFVVNIGDIAHITDLQARRTQPALDDVKADKHARMTEVTIVIYRHAADIHTGKTSPQRGKGTFRA